MKTRSKTTMYTPEDVYNFAKDGNVDELIGLKWYAKPIGSSFITDVYREKK